MINKLFIMAFFFDLFAQKIVVDDYRVNIVLLVIALIASLLGSSVQATHVSLVRKLHYNEILAIYITGFFIAYFAYEFGLYYNSFALTGVSSAILSYVSVEFVIMIKKAILFIFEGIYKKLPDVFLEVIRNLLKVKDNEKD